MQEWSLDLVPTTALAVVFLLIGYWLKRRISFFERFCIPAPVIGGFIIALLTWFLRESGIARINFDMTLQLPFMLAFFTTVGMGGSLGMLRSGGKPFLVYIGLCWATVLMQDCLGMGAAVMFGLDPAMGVMAGGVSLEGGHGTASAFGPLAEQLGTQGASTVALASATFGLVFGALLGGPLARWLINRHRVGIQVEDSHIQVPPYHDHEARVRVTSDSLISSMGLILVLMVGGMIISGLVQNTWDFILPPQVSAMFAAVLFRNFNDHVPLIRQNNAAIDTISDISLGIFLTMAMMQLKFWELYQLALPLLGILVLQVLMLLVFTIFIAFRALGKNYDAAVMCSGFIGHGLGATPNAVANMNAVCQHYRLVSQKAFLIIPLSGALMIDMIAVPIHTWILNFLH